MRLSEQRVKELQGLLKELYGLEFSTEQAQEAGLAVLRFVLAKTQRQQQLAKKESGA